MMFTLRDKSHFYRFRVLQWVLEMRHYTQGPNKDLKEYRYYKRRSTGLQGFGGVLLEDKGSCAFTLSFWTEADTENPDLGVLLRELGQVSGEKFRAWARGPSYRVNELSTLRKTPEFLPTNEDEWGNYGSAPGPIDHELEDPDSARRG